MSSKTVVLRSAVDSWVDSTRPSKSFPNSARLGLDSGEGYAFVYFPRPFPLGVHVVSAVLRFETAGSWGTTPTLTVRRVAAKYTASRTNWNNKPGVTGATDTESHASAADRDPWEFDVTSHLQQIADGAAWYGFRVETTGTALKFLRSSQSADGKPQLTVTWAEPPDTPTRLNPTSIIGIAKPVVTFDYSDLSGATAPASLQVQIDAANNFTSGIDFDSGEVVADLPRLDLNTTAYAGLADGSTTYWRVRAKDNTGLWSEWSDPVSMTRDNKGTLTITNPAAPASNYVQEFSPPITWTLSGETQESWKVDIVDPATGNVLHSSGQRAGTDLSYTLPDGRDAVIANGGNYRVDVYSWDTKDRVASEGDERYLLATRAFFVQLDAGTTGVSSLAAALLSPEPGVQLTWTRATAPDSFTILRDDVVVEANIPPGDVFVSGTNYAYIDYTPRPRVQATYKVVANVNNKASLASSVNATPKPTGIWLIDKERGLKLFLTKTSGSSWGMGEDAATFVALGSTAQVRVTQGVRGWEGSVSGYVIEYAGKTVQQWIDQALQMRARPGRTYTLVVGTEAFLCGIANMTVPPTGDSAPGMRAVSFEFFQTSEQRYKPVL